MKAAYLEEIGKMGIRDIPIPEIGPDDVLVKMKAAGVCGSDLHAYLGKHQFRFPPVLLGHEGAGVVYKVGENVKNVKVGDRVTVDPTEPCMHCHSCLEGNTNMCPDRIAPGTAGWFGGMGTWAEYFPIKGDHVYKINDDVSFARAALAEPMANSMHILTQVQGEKHDSICVIGCGTIGLFALLLAKQQGYKTVIGSDPVAFNREVAMKVGADIAIDPYNQDIEAEIMKATGGLGVDVCVVSADFPGIFDQAASITRRNGEIMLISMITEASYLHSWTYLSKQLSLRGSCLYNTPDFVKSLEIVNDLSVDLSPFMTHSMPVDDAGKALDLLEKKYENVIKITLTFDD